jgi:AcrR family transcriptional regulator
MVVSTDRRRTDTRDRLVEASLHIFAQQGYAGTRVSEIERAVGLTPGSGAIYRHFESKEALLLAAVRSYHDRTQELCAQIRSLGPAPDARTELTRIIEALYVFLGRERPMVEVAGAGDLPHAVRRAIGDTWDETYRLVADSFVRYGFDPDQAQVMAVGTFGSLAHYLVQAVSMGSMPNGVSADRFVVWWIKHWTDVLERGPD